MPAGALAFLHSLRSCHHVGHVSKRVLSRKQTHSFIMLVVVNFYFQSILLNLLQNA